ncbi:hypothetical protein PR202_ga25913 [Eleusine coracana subsp. coracana]|uniref:Uncharacterized protein n=1 Tax=Eleusine coracana subsp. coracana TaxID=191504 RepID=A0AAV5DC81_ELECO|nr:hypothetical protein PR202_ga25913 [Eleusine coracana subsp. coracana]
MHLRRAAAREASLVHVPGTGLPWFVRSLSLLLQDAGLVCYGSRGFRNSVAFNAFQSSGNSIQSGHIAPPPAAPYCYRLRLIRAAPSLVSLSSLKTTLPNNLVQLCLASPSSGSCERLASADQPALCAQGEVQSSMSQH